MNRTSLVIAALILVVISTAGSAQIAVFQDNFESGNLDRWIGKTPAGHQGRIVADALDSANHVLTFTGVNAAGDIFSAAPILVSSSTQRYILSFDFLALSATGVPPAEYGGFAGITTDPAGAAPHYWLAGTYGPALNVPASVATILSTDGHWHHYEVDFTEIIRSGAITSFRVMLEDWYDRGSVPGDIYFDNVKLLTDPVSIDQLIAQVEDSGLSSRDRRPLLATLNAAAASIERGAVTAAINELRAFEHKVHAKIGPDNPALANTLIGSAEQVIDSISHSQCATTVLSGPTENEIVLQLKTRFEIPAFPNFQQVCIYQSGEPYFWEVDLVELQSSFFGDGSPGLAISFFSGLLEENLSLFIPNSYIREHQDFRISSAPAYPPSGVGGITWMLSHSRSFPMSCQGYASYDADNNLASLRLTFGAGDFHSQ